MIGLVLVLIWIYRLVRLINFCLRLHMSQLSARYQFLIQLFCNICLSFTCTQYKAVEVVLILDRLEIQQHILSQSPEDFISNKLMWFYYITVYILGVN